MKPYYKEILDDYRQLRDLSKKQLAYREKELHGFLPKIKEIDRAISKTGIRMAKLAMSPDVDLEQALKTLESEIRALKQEKAILMTENNVPMSFLELEHQCQICKDTGFVESGQLCKCFKQKLIDRAYKMYSLRDVLDRENFSTFDMNFFSDEPFEDEDATPRQNMSHILAICEGFVHNFDHSDDNLIFYGTTGQGKTFLCNCIAKALLDKGHTVVYQTAFNLIKSLERTRFSQDNAEKAIGNDLLYEADLLILDDLGTEFVNSFSNLEFFNVINTRMLAKKKTLISTNLTPAQIKETYSDRVSSRLFGEFQFIYFYGKDLRWEV